jgi:hypothetical protein
MSGGGIRGKRKSIVGKYPSRMSNQTHLAPLSQNGSSDNNDDIDYAPVNGRQHNLDNKKIIFHTAKIPQSVTPGGLKPHAIVIGEERYKSLEEARQQLRDLIHKNRSMVSEMR